jgi:lipoate---protein ligase
MKPKQRGTSKPVIFCPDPRMTLKDLSFATPEENIYFDELLFQLAEKHGRGEYLRFWESPTYFVVLGRIGKEQEDVRLHATTAEQIPVLRRTSGGGTVLQGPGCLNYTFVLSKRNTPALNDLRSSYQWICGKIVEAVGALGVEAAFRPISDIALSSNEKKFSGNAQHRGKHYLLHHGTILYDFSLEKISQYLNMPKEMPDYRKLRHHSEFVTNIPVIPAAFKAALIKTMPIDSAHQPLDDLEASLLKNYIK